MAEALTDAQFAVHAVPVQHSRRFLSSIKVGDDVHQYLLIKLQAIQPHLCAIICGCPNCLLLKVQGMLPPDLPLISVSKGLEVSTGQMMSEIIPSALQRKQPAVFLSGPSFAREVMELCPTVVVVASKVPCILTTVSATVLLYKNCSCRLFGRRATCYSAGGSCQRVA